MLSLHMLESHCVGHAAGGAWSRASGWGRQDGESGRLREPWGEESFLPWLFANAKS